MKNKIYKRNCPDCGKEQTYKSSSHYNVANRQNRKCRSCCMKGKKHSEAAKKKISKNHSRHNLGKKLSLETRRKLSVANGGDGTLAKFCDARLISWSKAVRERDEYVCQHCNHDFYPHECHAHHIVPKAKFPQYAYDLDNGITLCKECHIYEHKHYGRYR